MGKIEEKLLEDLKKANTIRKEKLAKKFGFESAEKYLEYLKTKSEAVLEEAKELLKELKGIKEKKTKVKPIIHIVNLLDNSGSMEGSKFDNAFAGITEEVAMLKNETSAIYFYSLFNFIRDYHANLVIDRCPIELVHIPKMSANQGTPLYATIVLIAKTILANKDEKTKILLKIFTDGEDVHSISSKSAAIQSIKDMKKAGITVTFVGTESDVKDIIGQLEVDKSNTLVHNNTAKGVEVAFAASNSATLNYTKNVVAGNDVSKGFYKNIK